MKRWLVLGVGLCFCACLTPHARAQAQAKPTNRAAPPPGAKPPADAKPPPDAKRRPSAPSEPPPAAPGVAVPPAVQSAPVGGERVVTINKARALLEQTVRDPALGATFGIPAGTLLKDLALGDSLPQFIIPLNRLAGYTGQPLDSIMVDQQRLSFPVMLGGAVLFAVTVVRRGDVWRAAAIGSAQLMQSIIAVRTQAKAQARDPKTGRAAALVDTAFRVVTFSGLNFTFLEVDIGGAPNLVPLVTIKRLNLVRGEPQPAEVVLKSLVADAKAHNGLPS